LTDIGLELDRRKCTRRQLVLLFFVTKDPLSTDPKNSADLIPQIDLSTVRTFLLKTPPGGAFYIQRTPYTRPYAPSSVISRPTCFSSSLRCCWQVVGSAPFVRRRCDCSASSATFTDIQTYLLTYLLTYLPRLRMRSRGKVVASHYHRHSSSCVCILHSTESNPSYSCDINTVTNQKHHPQGNAVPASG